MPSSPSRSWTPWIALAVLLVLAGVSFSALLRDPGPAAESLTSRDEDPGSLVLGEYDVDEDAVLDGDTLKMPDGLRIRIRGLDTEEVFHSARDRVDADADFAAYARRKRGDGAHPVKFGTPAGEAATLAARRLIAAVSRLRLELDDPDVQHEDAFGRLLAHVYLLGPEGDIHFATEMIRQGHSPYFVKYGRSLRHDEALAAAEAEARRAERGIWATDGPAHYGDYDERLVWWEARAQQVDRWRREGEAPGRIMLDRIDAAERLERLVDAQATVFGSVRARKNEGRPRILWLRHRRKNDFPIVVFDEDVWEALDHDAIDARFVRVTGKVSLYRGRPQMIVSDASQISTD